MRSIESHAALQEIPGNRERKKIQRGKVKMGNTRCRRQSQESVNLWEASQKKVAKRRV